MKRYHPTYKIQKGDTIQTITNLFDIDQDTWTKYHNNKCPLSDIITKSLPYALEDIFLLPQLWHKKHIVEPHSINTSSSTDRLSSWVIFPKPDNMDNSYWLQYIVEEGKSVTEIRYKVQVCFVGYESENSSLYMIDRISDVFINDSLPELCMDELAYETGKTFFPMVAEIDEQCNWVELKNHEQIRNNWIGKVRPYVSLRYSGEVTNRYLAQMDEVVASKSRIGSIFGKELFFNFYFNTVYQNYTQQFVNEKRIDFYFGDSIPMAFNVKSELKRDYTPDGYKEIIQSGVNIKKGSIASDETLEDNRNTYAGRFLLEKKTNHIHLATGEWSLEGGNKKIKIILFPLGIKQTEKSDIRIDKPSKQKKQAK